jgi:hypothetical protein
MAVRRAFRLRGRKQHTRLGLVARLSLMVVSAAAGLWLAFVCVVAPPRNIRDACEIFAQYGDWYQDAKRASDRWEVPLPVLLAIIHRESGFRADAQPLRWSLFGFLSGPPVSSAFGYSQALDGTWQRYKEATGNLAAERSRFSDAVDFVGWYVHRTWKQAGIAKHDAYHNYLAYYFGHAGYTRGDNKLKPLIQRAAIDVQHQADLYAGQLGLCHAEMEQRRDSWWPFRSKSSLPSIAETERHDPKPVRFR